MSRVARVASLVAIAAAAACGAPRGGASDVKFASAEGADASGRPFTVLRFAPGGRAEAVTGSSVARHPSGDLVVAGTFVGRADVGVGPASLGPFTTAFVGRYTSSGRPRWVRWMASGADDGPRLAVDAAGDVVVASVSRRPPRPFGEPEAACVAPGGCPFEPAVHVLSPDGELLSARTFPSHDARERLHVELVGVDSDARSGAVTVAGRFGAGGDAFVARLGEGGGRRWFTRLASRGAARVAGLAVLADGDVVVVGDASGELRVDDRTLGPGPSGFVLRLSGAGGDARWIASVAGAALAVAADPSGDVFVVARDPSNEARVERREGATGELRWARALAAGPIRGASMDLAPRVGPVVALRLASARLGARVVALDGDRGAPLWSRDLAASDGASFGVDATSIASISPTEAVVTGWFAGAADLGGVRADGPWRRRPLECFDDDDGPPRDCGEDWAARTMFVARVRPRS